MTRKNRTIYVYAARIERDKSIKVKARKYFLHPSFIVAENQQERKDNQQYDLGLIKLDKIFPRLFISKESYFISNTICLPKESFKTIKKQEIAHLFGFGVFTSNERKSQYLRKMTVNIEPHYVLPMKCYNGLILCAHVTHKKSCKVSDDCPLN